MLTQEWPLLLGLMLFGLLVYWFADEYRDVGDPVEAIQSAGDRADQATGQFLGAVGAVAMTVTMIATTIGSEVMETASMLEPLLGQAPVVFGHVIVAGLGYLSLQGTIGLTPKEYGYAVILVTIIALFLRYGRD